MRKRLILGTVVGVMVFGGVFGMAASMTLTPDKLGANDELIAACDADGVTTAYTNAFDSTDNRYEVTEVTVKGIHDNCIGKTAKVQLADGTNVAISGASGSLAVPDDATPNANEAAITLGTAASAEVATNAHIVIG